MALLSFCTVITLFFFPWWLCIVMFSASKVSSKHERRAGGRRGRTVAGASSNGLGRASFDAGPPALGDCDRSAGTHAFGVVVVGGCFAPIQWARGQKVAANGAIETGSKSTRDCERASSVAGSGERAEPSADVRGQDRGNEAKSALCWSNDEGCGTKACLATRLFGSCVQREARH